MTMSYMEACDRGYDGPSPAQERRMRNRYRCSDRMCGAFDCSTCYPGGGYDADDDEQETSTVKYVTARKARKEGTPYEIKPGDRVAVTSGFSYEVDGPRTGYFRSYRRVSKGPLWTH